MAYNFADCDKKLADAREWLAREYRGLRTGRASPAILDSVHVEAYGSMTPLKQVANISVEDARTIRITAWDSSVIKEIERGIVAANLGVGTAVDSIGIRVTFPELSSERREQLIKAAKAKLEEARTTVRLIRDETWKDVQEVEKLGGMGEDEKFRLKEELQKKIDAANSELESAFDAKETEMKS